MFDTVVGRSGSGCSLLLVLALAFGGMWHRAEATVVDGAATVEPSANVGFELRICADQDLIQNPDDPLLAMVAAWKTQYDLQLARNMPFLLLRNTSAETTAEITGMTMTIGSRDFNFRSVQAIDLSPGVDMTIELQSTDSMIDADQFELGLSGLVPGMFALLRLDIDPDVGSVFPLPDFRTVLFQANGDGSDADNSFVEVTFDGASAASSMTLGGPVEDFVVDGPLFVGPTFHAHERMDHVRVFSMRQTGTSVVEQAVPEPSAWGLLVVGMLMTTGRWRRVARRSPRVRSRKSTGARANCIGT